MTPIQRILADQVNRSTSDTPVMVSIRIRNEAERAIVEEWLEECIRSELPKPTTGEIYVRDSQKGRVNG